jgi:hypothetical protein
MGAIVDNVCDNSKGRTHAFLARASAMKYALQTTVAKRDNIAQCATTMRCACIAILYAALPFYISNIFYFADRRKLDIYVCVLGAYVDVDARVKHRTRVPALMGMSVVFHVRPLCKFTML